MPDTLVIYPVVALVLPGTVAYGLGSVFKSIWPGLALPLIALASGTYFLSQASGSSWNDEAATNYVLAAFGLSFPALISAVVGGTFAHMRGR